MNIDDSGSTKSPGDVPCGVWVMGGGGSLYPKRYLTTRLRVHTKHQPTMISMFDVLLSETHRDHLFTSVGTTRSSFRRKSS